MIIKALFFLVEWFLQSTGYLKNLICIIIIDLENNVRLECNIFKMIKIKDADPPGCGKKY